MPVFFDRGIKNRPARRVALTLSASGSSAARYSSETRRSPPPRGSRSWENAGARTDDRAGNRARACRQACADRAARESRSARRCFMPSAKQELGIQPAREALLRLHPDGCLFLAGFALERALLEPAPAGAIRIRCALPVQLGHRIGVLCSAEMKADCWFLLCIDMGLVAHIPPGKDVQNDTGSRKAPFNFKLNNTRHIDTSPLLVRIEPRPLLPGDEKITETCRQPQRRGSAGLVNIAQSRCLRCAMLDLWSRSNSGMPCIGSARHGFQFSASSVKHPADPLRAMRKQCPLHPAHDRPVEWRSRNADIRVRDLRKILHKFDKRGGQ